MQTFIHQRSCKSFSSFSCILENSPEDVACIGRINCYSSKYVYLKIQLMKNYQQDVIYMANKIESYNT